MWKAIVWLYKLGFSLIDHPVSWAMAGFIIGLVLGANLASMWIILLALIGYLFLLRSRGAANPRTETHLVTTGPSFLICWLLGFVIHGLIF